MNKEFWILDFGFWILKGSWRTLECWGVGRWGEGGTKTLGCGCWGWGSDGFRRRGLGGRWGESAGAGRRELDASEEDFAFF